MAASLAQVMANCANGHRYPVGQCLGVMMIKLEQPPSGVYCASAFAALTKRLGHMHPDTNPPAGALVMWGGGLGHIALSAGGGAIWSTDWNGHSDVSRTTLNAITTQWNKPYLGWSDYSKTTKLNTGASSGPAAATVTATSVGWKDHIPGYTEVTAGQKALALVTSTAFLGRAAMLVGGVILTWISVAILAEPAVASIVKPIVKGVKSVG